MRIFNQRHPELVSGTMGKMLKQVQQDVFFISI